MYYEILQNYEYSLYNNNHVRKRWLNPKEKSFKIAHTLLIATNEIHSNLIKQSFYALGNSVRSTKLHNNK